MNYVRLGEILATEVTPIILGLYLSYKLFFNKKKGEDKNYYSKLKKAKL